MGGAGAAGVEVRGFAPRDLAAAAAFCERARARDPAVEPFGDRLPALAGDPRALPSLWRVAVEPGGALVGISFAALRRPDEAELHAAVLPEHRRRGLGRALAAPLLSWAAARPQGVLRAAVDGGPSGAPGRAFLAALGFEPAAARLTLRREGAGLEAAAPSGGVQVSAAAPDSAEDLAATLRLANEAWAGAPDAFPSTAADVQRAAREPGRLLLLGRTGPGAPEGYLSALRTGPVLAIEELAVLPAARRRGLGRALVAHALRLARPRTALLAVAEGNEPALRLYAQLGFRPAARRVSYELRGLPARAVLRHPAPVIQVREARPEDDAAVGELLVEGYVQAYARKMPHVVVGEERKRDLRAVAEKRRIATVLVAELDGRVVGTVALFRPQAPTSEAWLPGAADLRHLAVEPAHQGRGFSKALLDEAERIARGWGVSAICLHVRRGNEGVARLYEARGYVRDPRGDLDYPTVSLAAYALRF